METNETKIFFDAALEMALRAEIDHELAQTPSPAELKRKYPDTSRWDARLYAALKRQTRHSHMRKRLVMVLLVTALLAAGVFAANAELRHAIYTAVIQWLPTEMHLTYETDGDTLTALPEGSLTATRRRALYWTRCSISTRRKCFSMGTMPKMGRITS